MAGIALNAQHLGDDLQFLSIFTLHLEADATANFRKASRQMNESSVWPNVFCRALGYHVPSRRVPFRANVE
jgi:hypothetical protein